jgi:hypothetical protein
MADIDRLLDEDIPGPTVYESDKDLTQESLDRWHVGAYSATRNHTMEWIYVDSEWPAGRFTRSQKRAEELASEFAKLANSESERSGATDWTAKIWPGAVIAEQLLEEQQARDAYKPVEPL